MSSSSLRSSYSSSVSFEVKIQSNRIFNGSLQTNKKLLINQEFFVGLFQLLDLVLQGFRHINFL